MVGKDRTILASNAVLELTWTWSAAGLKLQGLKDVHAGQSFALEGELFQIALGAGRRYAASELLPVGQPRFKKLMPDPKSSRLAARIPGWQVELKLRSQDGRLAFVWRAVLRDDGNYVRQEMEMTPADDCVIAEIIWLDETIPGAVSAGSVDGSPMVGGNMFFGLEDPHAVNSAGQSQQVIGNWAPADLAAGKFQRKVWPVNAALLGSGTNEFSFKYQRGNHRLDITRVTLTENGREVARDEHAGSSGRADVKNVYSLQLTRVDSRARYELVAELGTDPKLQ